VERLRHKHRQELSGIAPENLIFVDESGVNLSFCRLWARSPRGLRAFGSAPQNWGDNITILSALSLQGTLASMYAPGSTDGELFLAYVHHVLVPELWPGAVVLLDNLSAHKLAGVEEAIEQAGARLLYLPPYSPDLNPIEKAWSKLKHSLRSIAARTYRSLSRAISKGLELISPADALGFFKHCGYHG
jgi:transposase